MRELNVVKKFKYNAMVNSTIEFLLKSTRSSILIMVLGEPPGTMIRLPLLLHKLNQCVQHGCSLLWPILLRVHLVTGDVVMQAQMNFSRHFDKTGARDIGCESMDKHWRLN